MQNNLRKRHPSLPSPAPRERLHREFRSSRSESALPAPTREQKAHLHYFGHIELASKMKRKRGTDEEPLEQPQQPCRKRNKEELPREEESQIIENQKEGAVEQDPIQYWVRTRHWPKGFAKMSTPESDGLNKRRRTATLSYSSRARDGSAPLAHPSAYEEELQRYGIIFDYLTSKDLLSTESQDTCQALLDLDNFAPAYNSCSEQTYFKLFKRATGRNEERVRRDLTSYIMPSAELLYVLNQETALENVREEMSTAWTKVNLLGGTRPRPDYAYGLSSATFTKEERTKLEAYTSFNNPTKFTESMYFPFLLCEAKCGKKNINDADRQNIHSASIAVNAILELCRAAGEDSAKSLSGHVLVFSISHDNERVKIYGHFPIVQDGHTTFHHYYIHDYSLHGHYGRDRNTGSNFTRAVYHKFYPLHLQRIRQAISRLPNLRTTSMVSDLSVSESEMQAREHSSQAWEHSSQEMSSSSRPPLRQAKSRGSQGELTLMKQQMYKDQLEQQAKQIEQQAKQIKQRAEQMKQQREDSQKQIALLERLLDQTQSK